MGFISRIWAVRRLAISGRALRLLVPIVSAVPVAVLFDAAGAVKLIEEPLTRIIAHRADPPPNASDVIIVQITDADLRSLFHDKHPLDPCKLVVGLNAVAALKPLAIAVDLDTSNEEYRKIPRGECGRVASTVPIVWATRVGYSQLTNRFYTDPPWGGAGAPNEAVAAVIADADSVVRKYRRSFPTDRGELLSLPMALRKAAGRPSDGTTNERLIYFYGHTYGRQRTHLPISQAIDLEGDPGTAALFKNKMVIVGADFRDIDEHPTPIGWMRGVEILAHIAESDPLSTPPTTGSRLRIVMLAGACLIAVCFDMLNARRAALLAASGMLVGLCIAWWYTHLSRDAILVCAVFVVIICQQIFQKIRRKFKEESREMKKSSEASPAAAHAEDR